MNSKIQSALILIALALSACAPANRPAQALPESWSTLPEDGAQAPDGDEASPRAEENLQRLLEATAGGLDAAMPVAPQATQDSNHWRLHYLITDLTVSAQGLIGALTAKGSPSVALFWRRHENTAPVSYELESKAELLLNDSDSENGLTESSLREQLAPAIDAAARSGRIQNPRTLEANLLRAARDFAAMTRAIAQNPGSEWWVSRFRLDLTADASGKVQAAPLGLTVGGDLRFRFEWHRLKKKTGALSLASSLPETELGGKLREFTLALASDLEAFSSAQAPKLKGFHAYGFRVGVGLTATKSFGVVKGGVGAIGQLYFSRDIQKPSVGKARASFASFNELASIPLIDYRFKPEHLEYAARYGIVSARDEDEDARPRATFTVDRARFRKGLEKAAKLSRFFTKNASQAKLGGWRIYELRTAFDFSITGSVGLTTVAGQATSEINFYNESF